MRAIELEVVDAAGERVTPTMEVGIVPKANRHPLRPDAPHLDLHADESCSRPLRHARELALCALPKKRATDGGVRIASIHNESARLGAHPYARRWVDRETREGYDAARAMLLEAAEGNSDPSVYEILADASAPWAPPDETATYYDRSLAVAKANLTLRFGSPDRCSEKAVALFQHRERKVAAFRELVPYYTLNFLTVRVVVSRQGTKDSFVVERRSDRIRIRVIDP